MADYHEGIVPARPSIFSRLFWFICKIIVYFALVSIGLTLAYKFVSVPTTATMLFDENGASRDWKSLDEISPNMIHAVIAAEDSRFCSHDGIDSEAIEKAMKDNAKGGRIRGGSTISQQTAKNVFLWQGGGYFRKILEAWFTLLVEQIWGKQRIMEVYLNVAETGIGTYGVEAGAQRYYKKSAKNLSRIESARIAAALPLPKKRNVINPAGFTRRYGNIISARINSVKRDGLANCVY